MEKNQQLGFIGAALLLVGAFAPVINVPIVGAINLMQGSDGYIIIGLAMLSGIILLVNKRKWLWVTGIAALGIIIAKFITLINKIGSLDDNGNKFSEAMSNAISMQWGWAALVIGAILLIIAAARTSPPSPSPQ